MASSREEQLLCPICLETYREPVSTPCGHNYCRTCITRYWANTGDAECPICLATFRTQPELKVNATLGNLVKRFSDMTAGSVEEPPAAAGEVACDLCPEPKLRARRSCLGCLASYCGQHLEQHQRVPAFKKHRLVEPAPNLEDNICAEHDEALKLFCQREQVCVCVMCLRGGHADHEAVPLESAYGEKRERLIAAAKEMERWEASQRGAIEDLKSSAKRGEEKWGEEMAEVSEALSSLVANLQGGQAEMAFLAREKQRSAQALTRGLVANLEREVGDWQRRRREVERVVQRENQVRLLRSFASLSAVPPARRGPAPARLDSCVGPAKEAITRMQVAIVKEMETLRELVMPPRMGARADWGDELRLLNPEQLKAAKRSHAVDVILDPGSAHSGLLVCQGGKTLMAREGAKPLSGGKLSWDSFALGKEGFSSGRFYFQVQISGAENCFVGVVSETKAGRWVLRKSTDSFQHVSFWSSLESPLSLQHSPTTLGVLVDYEKGEVLFFDADTGALVCSHAGCAFSEASVTMTNFLLSLTRYPRTPKLYPILGICESPDTLVIIPVAS